MLLDSFVLLMLSRCSLEQLWDFSSLATSGGCAHSFHVTLMERGTWLNISLTETPQEGNALVWCLNLTSDNGAFCPHCLWFSLLHVPPCQRSPLAFLSFYIRYVCYCCCFFPECGIFPHILKVFLKIVLVATEKKPPFFLFDRSKWKRPVLRDKTTVWLTFNLRETEAPSAPALRLLWADLFEGRAGRSMCTPPDGHEKWNWCGFLPVINRMETVEPGGQSCVEETALV